MPIERRDLADGAQVAATALELVLQVAKESIAARGRFVLVLAGGTTPAALYSLLADARQDWSQWHLVYGDERCLPDGDPQRNSTMVARSWLDRVQFPPQNHHIPPVDLGSEAAAAAYSTAIAGLLPPDLALLGMGQDGHTASLFPGHHHADTTVVAVHAAPKPPAERISLSYATLCSARVVCYLVVGEDKREVIEAFFNDDDIPATRVRGAARTVVITGGIALRSKP